MMNAQPLQPASDSWDSNIDVFVLPLSLNQYWEAYWADDAPYFIPAFRKDSRDEALSYSDWQTPMHGGDDIIGEPIEQQRVYERKIHGNSFINHTHELEIISLLGKDSSKITLSSLVFQRGALYAQDVVPHVRWEIMTDDPRSK